MDQTARMEAAAGPSTLGFQRTLLTQQVQALCDRFPTVPVQLATTDEEVDRLLDRAIGRSVYVVTDSAHLRRLHDLAEAGVTVIVPSARPESEPEVPALLPRSLPEVERELDTGIALESWWEAPTVDEPRQPALVPAQHPHLRRHRHLEP